MWSPKRKINGSRNQHYDNMRRLIPGDRVFSYYEGHLQQIGIIQDVAITAERPADFDAVYNPWADVGWRVPVHWCAFPEPLRPSDHIAQLRPNLPNNYSPINSNTGKGNQCYVCHITNALAQDIFEILGVTEQELTDTHRGIVGQRNIVNTIDLVKEEEVWNDDELDGTEKEMIVKARIEQGLFRNRVSTSEPICRVSGVTDPQFLRAGHIKPWRNCSNHERLDGSNGLMLVPNIDHIFDKGYITFRANGDMLISQLVSREQLRLLGIDVDKLPNVGAFSEAQEIYLDFHRKHVFLG